MATKKCAECKINPLSKTQKQFCSTTCRNRANARSTGSRRAQAAKAKRDKRVSRRSSKSMPEDQSSNIALKGTSTAEAVANMKRTAKALKRKKRGSGPRNANGQFIKRTPAEEPISKQAIDQAQGFDDQGVDQKLQEIGYEQEPHVEPLSTDATFPCSVLVPVLRNTTEGVSSLQKAIGGRQEEHLVKARALSLRTATGFKREKIFGPFYRTVSQTEHAVVVELPTGGLREMPLDTVYQVKE